MGQKLELAEVMKALREEIKLAEWAGQGHDLKFNLNNIEVEFQTVVEKEGGLEGGGKIKFWVLDIDAKASGKYKKSATQKIRLSLTPDAGVDGQGKPKKTQLSDDE
ncbi:trypco2 family protein [Thiothrix subterranea]|uniref:Trypco2 family protein n=1 Tax=Thiothrix subterranea TaxID=2735563 RepID=A0AA51MKL8_9GAMM|nr:trypco2 family protein [Thiothrix subterranea]MDQ5770736.1 trypco2 family protein [Thiothrix subterranea]WML85620.1 trypco2 family protein [Thiothrix subterranea]